MRYRKIAVAAGFSPTLPALLAEAGRLAAAFGADWQIIHAAEETREKANAFAEAFHELENPPSGILWSPSESPLAGILAAVQSGECELLISGALEREPEHRTFLGSVARGLMNELCCDKLFLSRPQIEASNPLKLAVAMAPSGHERTHLAVAVELSHSLPVTEIMVAGVDSLFASASGLNPRQVAEQAAEELRSQVNGSVKVDWHCVQSNTGFGLCDFVQGVGPDLFVTAAAYEGGRYLLPTHLSWLHQVIPCNTLIVRG